MHEPDQTPAGAVDGDGGKPKGGRRLASRIQESFSPTKVEVAGDGGPVIQRHPELVVLEDRDWICLRGPCRNYHRLVTTMDAQQPMDGSLTYEDGTPLAKGRQSVHTCYPAPGIEVDMTDVVVTECSRWDPESTADPEVFSREVRRERWRELDEERANAENAVLAQMTEEVEKAIETVDERPPRAPKKRKVRGKR